MAEKKLTKRELQKIAAQKELEKRKKYIFDNFGLTEDLLITHSSLKNIFTDSVIAKNFPQPYSEVRNPHPGGGEMKLYRLADVMEKMQAGVNFRLKTGLPEQHYRVLSKFSYEISLPKNPPKNTKVVKV